MIVCVYGYIYSASTFVAGVFVSHIVLLRTTLESSTSNVWFQEMPPLRLQLSHLFLSASSSWHAQAPSFVHHEASFEVGKFHTFPRWVYTFYIFYTVHTGHLARPSDQRSACHSLFLLSPTSLAVSRTGMSNCQGLCSWLLDKRLK